ncbi:MAG TPA: ABC transporter permease [Thermoanaerobaculia bacterium]|nr:ABC transporter permease [Thermoanaerobaculia bacterium]
MTVPEAARFAWQALAAHRLRTLLSLLGMSIGVAAVVILTALGEGAKRYVLGEFASLGSNLLIVVPGRSETTGSIPGLGGTPHDLTLEDAAALEREVQGILRAVPIAIGTEYVAHRERRRQVAVMGSTEELLPVRKLAVARGRFLPPSELERGAPVVVLGRSLATELFPASDPVGQVVRVAGWRLKVIGVLAPRGVQLGVDMDEVAIVPVAIAMRLFDRSSLFRILLEARRHEELDAIQAQVEEVLAERHGERDVTVLTQEAVLASFQRILAALTLAVGAIAAISLAVAGIGIMNVMLVSVSERTSEVGLLKALGGQRRQVLGVFLLEAGLLSLAGGLVGLTVGQLGVLLLLELFPAVPARAPLWAVVAAVGTALVVGVLFGVLPARRASRLEPVAALARR